MVFELTASLLYRLAKTRMTWAALALFALLIAAGVAALKVLSATPALGAAVAQTSTDTALALGVVASGEGGVSALGLCGALFVRGSAIAMFAAAFCGLFFAADMRTGFVKNLMQAPGARVSYAAASALTTACVCVLYVAVGIVVSLAAAAAAGFPLALPDSLALVAWAGQVAAVVYAYALGALAVALITRSAAAACIAGVLLGGAAVENVLYAVLSLATGSPQAVRELFSGYLAVTISQLGNGIVQPWPEVAAALCTAAAAIAALAAIMKLRRLA